MEILHPILQRNEAAQDLCDSPLDTPRRLRKLGGSLLACCREVRLLEHNPGKAHYLILRNVVNACIAPILHGIEIEASQQVATMRRNGVALAPPESTNAAHFDSFFDNYGKFEGRNLAFLRASSSLGNTAVTRFLKRAAYDPQH